MSDCRTVVLKEGLIADCTLAIVTTQAHDIGYLHEFVVHASFYSDVQTLLGQIPNAITGFIGLLKSSSEHSRISGITILRNLCFLRQIRPKLLASGVVPALVEMLYVHSPKLKQLSVEAIWALLHQCGRSERQHLWVGSLEVHFKGWALAGGNKLPTGLQEAYTGVLSLFESGL